MRCGGRGGIWAHDIVVRSVVGVCIVHQQTRTNTQQHTPSHTNITNITTQTHIPHRILSRNRIIAGLVSGLDPARSHQPSPAHPHPHPPGFTGKGLESLSSAGVSLPGQLGNSNKCCWFLRPPAPTHQPTNPPTCPRQAFAKAVGETPRLGQLPIANQNPLVQEICVCPFWFSLGRLFLVSPLCAVQGRWVVAGWVVEVAM